MAALTTSARKRLPLNVFAGPNRTFPVPDPSHARNALARASQAVNAGRMSSGQASAIRAKAREVLERD